MRQRAGGKDRRHKKEHLLLLFCEMQHGKTEFKGEIERRNRGEVPGTRIAGRNFSSQSIKC
jgi:hypothetical protein